MSHCVIPTDDDTILEKRSEDVIRTDIHMFLTDIMLLMQRFSNDRFLTARRPIDANIISLYIQGRYPLSR